MDGLEKKVVLEKTKEVSLVDQFVAVMNFLEAMGYETKDLSLFEAGQIRFNIMKAINIS